MNDIFSRTRLVLGNYALERLAASRVAVFGLGGVGGYVAEALARSGIGALDIIDRDTVNLSNLNRQIIALNSTIGRYKTDVMEERIKDINPECRVTAHRTFFLPETADSFDFSEYDFIADAVDTVTAKLEIIARARAAGKPVISCMGTGGKTDPSMLEITDIYNTSVCPLARVMRTECRKRGIDHLTVVYSREIPVKSGSSDPESGKPIPGSTAFVPPSAGLLIASYIVRYLGERQRGADI